MLLISLAASSQCCQLSLDLGQGHLLLQDSVYRLCQLPLLGRETGAKAHHHPPLILQQLTVVLPLNKREDLYFDMNYVHCMKRAVEHLYYIL